MNNTSTSTSYHLFVYNLNKLYLAFLSNLVDFYTYSSQSISNQMRLLPVGQAPLLTIVTLPPDLQFALFAKPIGYQPSYCLCRCSIL